ncbi:MAG TPA: hypothetical protein VJ715_13825 [Pyrinomonadaceae bacterium]|nr:hypothetical protein [Pyrinomonadaceae bacterium]
MFRQQRTRKLATLAIALLLTLTSAASGQDKPKKKKVPLTGTPVLWRDPGDISSRDLFLGPGGAEMKPDISNVTFLKDEVGGYSAGFRVRDGAGNIWVTKLGKESQPETAASRFVWAVGYVSEIHYLFPCVHIKGAPNKKVERCEGDGFANVRFEARPKKFKRQGTVWSWANNPFSGTKELKGLIVMMAFLNNWDLKDDNNKLVYVPGSDGAEGEMHYILSDLGATFGKTGGFLSRSRNEPEDYAKSKFIEGVEGGRVKFAYSGKNSGLFKDITVEDARWVGSLLSKLSDQQLTDAFRAANFTPEEVQTLVGAARARINQLVNLPGGAVAGTN